MPRLLARLSDLYTFPVASLQSSRKLLDGDSSPPLLSSLPVFNSSEPAQVSSRPTTMRQTPPALLPRSSSGLNSRFSPTLLGLPVELRYNIFNLVLDTKTSIHVQSGPHGDGDRFLFIECFEPLDMIFGCRRCAALGTDKAAADVQYIDSSLLQVCKVVREEASVVMFSLNTFHFSDRTVLESLLNTAPDECGSMQSLSFRDTAYDDSSLARYDQHRNRGPCKLLLNLRSLTIYLRIGPMLPAGVSFFDDGILNFFRPFSRLPLQEAHVHIKVILRGKDQRGNTPDELAGLERKAQKIMMRDPSLPEEDVRMMPEAIQEAVEAWKKGPVDKLRVSPSHQRVEIVF